MGDPSREPKNEIELKFRLWASCSIARQMVDWYPSSRDAVKIPIHREDFSMHLYSRASDISNDIRYYQENKLNSLQRPYTNITSCVQTQRYEFVCENPSYYCPNADSSVSASPAVLPTESIPLRHPDLDA